MSDTAEPPIFESKFAELVAQDVGAAEPPEAPASPPEPEPDPNPPKDEETKPSENTEDASDSPSAENFRRLRESKTDLEQRLKALEAEKLDLSSRFETTAKELDSYKTTYSSDEFDKLKAREQELQRELAELDVTKAPEVVAAKRQAEEVTEDTLTKLGRTFTGVDWQKTLALSPEARDRALTESLEQAEASSATQSRVWALVDKLDDVKRTYDSVLDDAKANVEGYRRQKEQAAVEAESEKQKTLNGLYTEGLKIAQDPEQGLPNFYRELEGQDEHNALVREATSYARDTLLNPMDETRLAQTAFYAGVGRVAEKKMAASLEAIAALQNENASLKEQVVKMTTATPAGATTDGGSSSAPSLTPWMDQMNKDLFV